MGRLYAALPHPVPHPRGGGDTPPGPRSRCTRVASATATRYECRRGTRRSSTPVGTPATTPGVPGMARPAYRDREYRAAVSALKVYPQSCRCGRPATTIDHVPALALHTHTRNGSCCLLVPACTGCNCG